MTEHERFRETLEAMGHGAIAELERRGGISRRTIERKRDGAVPVTVWDCWALEKGREVLDQFEQAVQAASDVPEDVPEDMDSDGCSRAMTWWEGQIRDALERVLDDAEYEGRNAAGQTFREWAEATYGPLPDWLARLRDGDPEQ